VFEGENAPLLIAEVEIDHADQPLDLPSWCCSELTGLGRFSNAALAREPFRRWSPADQAPWLEQLQFPADPETSSERSC